MSYGYVIYSEPVKDSKVEGDCKEYSVFMKVYCGKNLRRGVINVMAKSKFDAELLAIEDAENCLDELEKECGLLTSEHS